MRASVAIQEGGEVTRSLVEPLTCTILRRYSLDATIIETYASPQTAPALCFTGGSWRPATSWTAPVQGGISLN